MKGPISTNCRLIGLFILTLLLQACGGSGNTAQTYTISADISQATFSSEAFQATSESIAVKVTFDGEGLLVGFSPDAPIAPWLSYQTENVGTNSATVLIKINTELTQGILPANLYKTSLRLSTGSTADRNLTHHDINISLLVWQLMSFEETFGAQTSPSQTITLTNYDQTLSATADVNWLTVETLVDSDNVDNTQITVTPTLTEFTAAGLSKGNITITDDSGKLSFPVELGLDSRYLFADRANIAFSATPGNLAVEQTITINSNSLSDYSWQASTETSWLTLTPIPDSQQLKVSADPLLAPANTISDAKIIIASLNDNTIIEEIITVNLYHSDVISENNSLPDLTVNTNALVTAPSLPYVYMGVGNELRVYHQYSNELISSVVISPAETLLSQLIIHPNGKLLLARADETVVDGEQSSTIIHRYKIDLTDTAAITATEINDITVFAEPMLFARFDGRYFVVTQALEIADENLQLLYWDNSNIDDNGNIFIASKLNMANLTGGLFALRANSAAFNRYKASVNDFSDNKVSISLTHSYIPESLAEGGTISDFVITDDESALYLMSPTSQWLSFDGSEFTDNGLLEPDSTKTTQALAISHDNRPHFARLDPSIGYVIDVYDNQQNLITSTSTEGNFPASIALSADNRRAVINAVSSNNVTDIEFVNLSQFTASSTSLTFTAILGEDITSQTLTIAGIGENWQANSNATALLLTQDNSGEQASLIIDIDHTVFNTTGSFSASMTITDPDNNTSAVITINLVLTES